MLANKFNFEMSEREILNTEKRKEAFKELESKPDPKAKGHKCSYEKPFYHYKCDKDATQVIEFEGLNPSYVCSVHWIWFFGNIVPYLE